jgi:hypothetical protein
MSAAATAAGYLYASGRLRGRATREGAEGEQATEKRREIKVAAYPPREERSARQDDPQQAAARPARTPRIEYRTRRWKPE